MRDSPTHIKFARALRQIEQASNNLSDVSAECGDQVSLQASKLLSQVHNALIHGSCYQVYAHGICFDEATKKEGK